MPPAASPSPITLAHLRSPLSPLTPMPSTSPPDLAASPMTLAHLRSPLSPLTPMSSASPPYIPPPPSAAAFMPPLEASPMTLAHLRSPLSPLTTLTASPMPPPVQTGSAPLSPAISETETIPPEGFERDTVHQCIAWYADGNIGTTANGSELEITPNIVFLRAYELFLEYNQRYESFNIYSTVLETPQRIRRREIQCFRCIALRQVCAVIVPSTDTDDHGFTGRCVACLTDEACFLPLGEPAADLSVHERVDRPFGHPTGSNAPSHQAGPMPGPSTMHLVHSADDGPCRYTFNRGWNRRV